MSEYYVVGMGGCGAKCVEALIHLCASGLGPDTLRIGLVDPDDTNGNVQRTAATLESYKNARRSLWRQGESEIGSACRFMATDIEAGPSGLLWSPIPPSTPTMRELFNYSLMQNGEKALMDALFLNPAEQQMPLHEGFRGRPSVGAAVLGAIDPEKDPFWFDIFQATTRSKQGEDVRLFLMGSIFGGTGASAFPVVARMLRKHVRSQHVEKGARLSGVLFLPYFSYPPSLEGQQAVAADPNVFLAKAQQSLDYYQSLIVEENVFDDLYLIGWPKLISFRENKTGGKDQCNPPVLPELYGALAACHFFHAPRELNAELNERRQIGRALHIAAGSEEAGSEERIGWADLPDIGTDLVGNTKERLGQAMRFAYAYARIYAVHLARDQVRSYQKDPWYRFHLNDVRDIFSDSEQRAVDSIKEYCNRFLRYFTTISRPEAAGGMHVQLFGNTGFALNDLRRDDALIELRPEVSRQEERRFSTLVLDGHAATLHDVYSALCDRRTSQGSDAKGLGRLVASLYALCALGGAQQR